MKNANDCWLIVELQDEKACDLTGKVMETRTGVADTKHTIDGMRTTRDTQMSQQAALKMQLREQNQRLLLVSQEKVRMEAKNRMNAAAANPAGTTLFPLNIFFYHHIIALWLTQCELGWKLSPLVFYH